MRETVRAIILDQKNRIFLVQHRERNISDLGKWSSPGGGIDKADRDHLQALTRELTEEFGQKFVEQIKIGPKLRVNHQLDRIDHFYGVKFFGGDIHPQAPEEIMSFSWFTIEKAKDLKLFFGFEVELAVEVSCSP